MTSRNKKTKTQGNMTGEDKVIEQLWYTWSDVGIDSISAGFRIRAASEGLRDLRSELVQRLDPYERYLLPRDAGRSIDPKLAPICLTLINTGKERILVHKVYTGQDGVGRYGAFFIHLLDLPKEASPTDASSLVNPPEGFSPRDAISLWQSPFWQNSDVNLKDRRSTDLERVSLAGLRQQQKKRALDQQSKEKVRQYLPAIIEAYLTKNLLREQKGSQLAQQKIYIAASDNDVAQLISGLIQSLPAQLVQDLTFSTYEHDVNEATTEIVGTCWLSRGEKDPIVAHLLPAHYYQEKLAFNCYTNVCSPLLHHPQVLNHPFAAQCAKDATEYFLNSKSSPEFQDLLDTAIPRIYPHLSVNKFLELYETLVIRAEKPSQSDVETALTPRTPHEYEISAKLLSRSSYRNMLIHLVLHVPNWWETHKKELIYLRERSSQDPLLDHALTEIVLYALSRVIDIVKKEGAPPREVSSGNEALVMVDVIRCAVPLEKESSMWHTLLSELLQIKQTLDFLRNHRNIYVELMKIWSIALHPPEDNTKLITPLLTVSWAEFGNFLALKFPLDWVEIATKGLVLVDQSPPPTRAEISHLEQQYHPYVENLLVQLSQDPQRWLTATALFHTLIKGTYQKKMSLLSALLNSPMGKNERTVPGLLKTASLTLDEKASFLEKYGPYYLPDSKLRKIPLNMFTELASSNLQQAKMRALFSWLASPHLSSWFGSPQTGEKNLAEVLAQASLNIDEIGEFFQNYGEKYITLYPGSSTLISLFDSYSSYISNKTDLRIFLLDVWLKHNLQEALLTRVLVAAHLTSGEKVSFLEKYGPHYLPDSKLKKIPLNMFTELASTDLRQEKMRVLFSWLASPHLSSWFDSPQTGEKNLAEVLAQASLNTDEISEFFQNYGKKYIPLYPGSSTLISLFETYAKSGTELRLSFLNIWLECNLQDEKLTLILYATHLTSDEKVSFLQSYGERYLSLYPQSPLLVNYVQEFLSFLRDSNVAIFKGRWSPEEPSATERLLRFLSQFSPLYPYVSRELVYDWYHVAQFVRKPSLLRQSRQSIALHIGRLLSVPDEVQPPMRTDLLTELAVVCITNEDDAGSMIDSMLNALTPPTMLELLYKVAESVSDGISQKRYAKTLFVPCIHSALDFKALTLQWGDQQEFSVEHFLDTLLQNADEKTLNWLNRQVKHWPALFSNEWRRYIDQRLSHSIEDLFIATSLFDHIKFFLERVIAFIQKGLKK